MSETCKNNYTYEEYVTEFGKDENDLKTCNKCGNLTYEDGIATCEKFENHKGE